MAEFTEISKEKNGEWQHLVEYCIDLYETNGKSEYRKDKIEEIKEARKIYEQKADKATFPWPDAANYILPLETITIDNMEPRLVAGLTAKKPILQFNVEGSGEKGDFVEMVQQWFNEELEERVEIERVSRSIVHDLLLEGTVYKIPEYSIKEEMVRDFEYDNNGNVVVNQETGEAETTDKKELLYEGGRIDSIAFTDILISDDVDDWEKAEIVRKIRPTYAELMRSQGNYGYMNIGPWLLKEQTDNKLKEDAQTPSQAVVGVKVSKEVIECIECHIPYIYKDKEQPDEDQTDFTEEKIIAVISVNKQILVRLLLLRDLNFKNEHLIKRIRLFPEMGRSYGTSLHGKMKSIQAGASDTFNIILNVAYLVMMPWFIYGNKSGLKTDNVLYPGKGIPADDPKDVVFPDFKIYPHQYIPFIEMFFTLWERLGSIADPQIGRQKEKETTATEWMGLIQEGNIKHNYQAQTIREEFIALLKTLYDLYYQYMPLDKKFTYRGKETPVPRQFMNRKFKFRLTGSTELANKFVERKEAEDLYMMLGQNPNINPIKIVERLIKVRDPDANIQEYIIPQVQALVAAIQQNPELQQVVQEYLQDKKMIAEKIGEQSDRISPER
uniref:Putative structural protein n=2 Tax=viral metagenome TaxID=1070528 RepID=A0A6M3J1Z6_9ZZZZ